MSRHQQRRVQALTVRIEEMPIAPSTLQKAFETFHGCGELPPNVRLASAVLERTRQVGVRDAPELDLEQRVQNFIAVIDKVEAGDLEPTPEDARESLFQEALSGDRFVRAAACAALRRLVGQGADITDLHLFDDVQVPDFGTVGLSLVGFPDVLGKAPNGLRVHRLLDRFVALRNRVAANDDAWFAALAEAGLRFRCGGTLPEDAVLRDAVHANAELIEVLELSRGDEALDLLRLAAVAGDVAAHEVMFRRLHYSGVQTPDLAVGPPVPRGRELIAWARSCADYWSDYLATGTLGGVR